MATSRITEGCFVQATEGHRRLGLGKVAEIAGTCAKVVYFHSVGRSTTCDIQIVDLQRFSDISSQTRCYFRDGDRWVFGRVGRFLPEEGRYEVWLREGKICWVQERDLFVRAATAIDDPIETLIHRAQETPFFHDRRFRFVRSLTTQRAACRGMTGLLSSCLDLLPHQVEVVRRVLRDPVQRYLLSDEVGLGKTIEAGAILRQYLLDDRRGCALLLMPPLLLDQWAEELESKFRLSRLGQERVRLCGHDRVEQSLTESSWGLVLIDEAQHLAAEAYAEGGAGRDRFGTVRKLCAAAERVLLLSATPVLNNERDFLGMLHLLDPAIYRLEELEGFRQRVARRQDVGRLLLSLQEGASAYPLRSGVRRLRELFGGDEAIARLAGELEQTLAANPVDGAARDRLVRAIRVHVSETYRLHRRMLRSRRASVNLEELAGRGGPRTPRKTEYDLDERAVPVHDLLEEWRETAVPHCPPIGEDGSLPPLARLFVLLFELGGSWPDLLLEACRLRAGSPCGERLRTSLPAADLRLVADTPHFPGEATVLDALISALSEAPEDGDRIDLVVESLANTRDTVRGPAPKCVVFSSYPAACRELLKRARARFGARAAEGYLRGLSAVEVREVVGRFRDDPDCFILICDRAGEEGRNLQFADHVVHFDLPFSPNRVEQRVGRLDRIGRTHPVSSIFCLGPDCEHSLYRAWYRALDEGFGVFDGSIASLQFFADGSLPRLAWVMLTEGAGGLEGQISTLREGIRQEQDRLNEQDALDTIDALDQSAADCFRDLEELEKNHAGIERDFDGWVVDALKFRRDRVPGRAGLVKYTPDIDKWRHCRTLVPLEWLNHRLGRHLECPGTFERQAAIGRSGVNLYRAGDGFVDTMASYVRWDDRGQAFALWRVEPGWEASEGGEWLGFRFNYVVSANIAKARELLAHFGLPASAARSLQRQADALLPPQIEVAFLDSDGRPVDDAPLLAILSRPYLAADKGGTDYSIAHDRLACLDPLIDPARWPAVCQHARQRSAEEILGRGSPPLRQRCLDFARQAERELHARVEQLRLRLARDEAPERLGGTGGARELELEQALSEALVAGIREPELRLDSVGFLVMSGRRPVVPVEQEDEA